MSRWREGVVALLVGLCVLGSVAGCGTGKQQRVSPPQRAACLNEPDGCLANSGVYSLSGYTVDAPEAELHPIHESLADAEVVGLGESAHASAGFIGLKVRLSRYLIEKSGFRAVTWESARVPARRLDAFVQTCSGDPAEAVKSLYEIWADVQTRDFAQWLCRWNQANPTDRVQVHGFDVQDPASDRAELEAFLSQSAPAEAATLMGGLTACERRQLQACRTAIGAIESRVREMAQRSSQSASAGLAQAAATARIALTSYAARQEQSMISDYARSFEARDVGMASVFLQLRDLHFPGQKALIWGHNIHVVRGHQTVAESWVGGPIVTQGTELDRRLGGQRYRAVAMIGYDVWLNRPGQKGHVTPSPTASSLEAMLHELDQPGLFIDLTHPNIEELIPAGRPFELGAPGVEVHAPAENYDSILYLEESPMAEIL